jgi:hypothetical protein
MTSTPFSPCDEHGVTQSGAPLTRSMQPKTPCTPRRTKRLVLIAGASLAVCACAPPIVTANSSSCSSLLPPSWKDGVAGAPLPEDNTVADWEVFGDAQTGKLDTANGRTKDAIGIVERCEARDAAAVKSATRRRLFGIPL